MSLTKAHIESHLRTRALGRALTVLPVADSTNRLAMAAAKDGAPHGTVIVADTQTDGHGQKGRSFFSPAGCGLYVSILWRSPSSSLLPLMTSCTAVAAARAIESVAPVSVQIKWVNDLIIDGRKIAGILTQGEFDPTTGQPAFAVIGIGINVHRVDFPDELKPIAGTVQDACGVAVDRGELLAALLNELETALSEAENRAFLTESRRRSCVIGRPVRVTDSSGTYTADAVDLDENGQLIIERDGARHTLIAGDVQVR